MSLPVKPTFAPVPNDVRSALVETTRTAAAAFSAASQDGANVDAALAVCDAMADLRAHFDRPEIRTRIQSLQDTPIGFRTDSDPKVFNKKKQAYQTAYEWPVVRDCAIEAVLRGLQLVGNQFNIISARTYVTREGFEFLIRKAPGISEFTPTFGVPANRTGGVIVPCSAAWKQHGVSRTCTADIPVKSDEYAGADQHIGKAVRKFLKRCYEMMTGQVLAEGDAAEPVPTLPDPAQQQRLGRPPETRPRTIPATTAPAAPAKPAATGSQAQQPPQAGTPPPGAQGGAVSAQAPAGAVNPAAEPAPEPGVLQNRLAAEVASWGFRKFDQFRAVAIKMGILSGMEEDAGAYLELTNKTTKVFLASLGGLRKAMEAEYGVQAHEAGQEGGAQ